MSVAPEQLVSTLARKFRVDVQAANKLDTDPWTQLRGVQELTPGKDDTMEDSGDYDSDGWGAEERTGQSWSLEATVARKKGITTGTYDSGQEIIRLASTEFGSAGMVKVRWYDRNGGTEAYQGLGTAGFSDDGGSNTDLSTAKITISGNGKRTNIANPAGGGQNAAGTAILSGATVQAVELTSGGSGYTTAPTVSFTGGGGTGATAVALIRDGRVVAVDVTAAGTGYTAAPTVVFTRV